MANTSASLAVGSGGHLDMAEIFQLLESSDLSVLDETVALVRDNLGSITEPWLLNGLVDYYIQSGNLLARNLLCMVRQQQYKALMNKIDDYLQKVATRLKALSLLGYIVRSEPIWAHHIISTKTFQSVIKCLQVDTDLPTITSALYVTVTLLPKVASQVPSFLNGLCAIYVRLVAWHTIKPVGADGINLLHLHAAVYALFLCLYGMYPCFFTKYLQQHFQVASTSNKASNLTEKEKETVFENSVKPMLDQVRLHPRLICDSSDVELSSEKWRKLESQDIIADISKVTLDATENSGLLQTTENTETEEPVSFRPCGKKNLMNLKCKIARADSDNMSSGQSLASPLTGQEFIWSPSVAIGLSTPPQSRGISPTPYSNQLDSSQLTARFQALQVATDLSSVDAESSNRPFSLNMTSNDGFVPNRPHQTSSSTSTPLKHFAPLLFAANQSPSLSQQSPPLRDSDNKRNHRSGGRVEEFSPTVSGGPALIFDEPLSNPNKNVETLELTKFPKMVEIVSGTGNPEQDACDKESHQNPLPLTTQLLSSGQNIDDAFVHITCAPGQDPIREFTPGLQPSEDYQTTINKPTETSEFIPEGSTSAQKLLNLSSGDRYIEKSPNELLDLHIQLIVEAYTRCRDKVPISGNKDPEWQQGTDGPTGHSSSAEMMYLRSEVLQMHCAMLYERHRREQHALRARKLMRKVFQLQEKIDEMEDRRITEKEFREKVKQQIEAHGVEMEILRAELKEIKSKNEDLEKDKMKLEQEKKSLGDECGSLKDEVAKLGSKLFALEQQLKKNNFESDKAGKLELELTELQTHLFESRIANGLLEDELKQVKGNSKARAMEAKLLSEAYERDLEALKTTSLRDKTLLEVVTAKADQLESELQRKDLLLAEQKKYLENVKSLARGQIQAMEAKYSAQKHISQRLEIQVLELFNKLSLIEGEMAVRERTHLSSGPRSIQPVSALQSHGQHQHILGSSPQLSPPIRDSPLADSGLWSRQNNG
ncbi:hamartin-like isoform X2 [Clavelina lepadiformis]|uniref:hamartin-like isoform X2 n=1 Tax=Clavelina lepadiformis TaxID=159417 RepID=UPI004043896A